MPPGTAMQLGSDPEGLNHVFCMASMLTQRDLRLLFSLCLLIMNGNLSVFKDLVLISDLIEDLFFRKVELVF